MIVYSATKTEFQTDVLSNNIGNIIFDRYRSKTGRSTGKSEIDSWANSLQYMDRVLNDSLIPADSGVAIEYHITQSSKRIDFILSGKDEERRDSAILIELKQWQKAELTTKDAVVVTRFRHGEQETTHPSYQAWSYKTLLESFNQTVVEENIQLFPCAYLHNYDPDNVITNEFYREHLENAPVFLKPDALKLREFIKKHIKYGDNNQLMYRIDHGKIKPSKNLADQLASMLQGNPEFIMIDDQKIVYETALQLAANSSEKKKNVLIVEGGPGTGKSVLAINLLVELTKREMVAQYITRNSAPRKVYEAKLTGSMKKSHISNLFGSSGSFYSSQTADYDCLIIDEAHRLNEKSGMFQKGENQIKELIRASHLSVFLLDEDQKVTLKDIGDKEEIIRWAHKHKARVTLLKLESQFRCNGSDGYLAWLDNTLQIRNTANTTLEGIEYDFRVFDSPREVHKLITEKNKEKNKARVVAGYCWKWISKGKPILKDIVIGDYKATWNLAEDGQAWIIQPESVKEVGCIHTCQGLEVDYIGVIIGPDLIVRNGKVITQIEHRPSEDKSVQGWKALLKENPGETKRRLEAIVKNTYRTLMTRGQKGCYLYCTDPETNEYFKQMISTMNIATEEPAPSKYGDLRLLKGGALRPYENAIPVFDIKIAAGAFSENQLAESEVWAEFEKPQKDLFICQVVGESMNKRIPNGSWCLFRLLPEGSRHGRIVLVQQRGIADPDYGGQYTIKRYESEKVATNDESWEHSRIILRPESTDTSYETIELKPDQEGSLQVIAEFVRILA